MASEVLITVQSCWGNETVVADATRLSWHLHGGVAHCFLCGLLIWCRILRLAGSKWISERCLAKNLAIPVAS